MNSTVMKTGFKFALVSQLIGIASAIYSPSIPTAAERKPPPSQAVLNAIRDRGRLLAMMDRAAWVCTDRFRERRKALSKERGAFIAYIDNGTYKVAFGVGSEDGKTFLTSFEGIFYQQTARCDLDSFDPPRQDDGWLKEAYAAIQLARKAFKADPNVEAYNYAVVPESAEEVSVYFYPGTTGQVPVLGADAKISVRGEKTEVTRYHIALLKQVPPEKKGDELVASMHTHLLDNLPNPLDVLYVMNRWIKAPEYILGEVWVFYINLNGEIEFAAYTDQVGKGGIKGK